jgi:hypothetical protein
MIMMNMARGCIGEISVALLGNERTIAANLAPICNGYADEE